MLRWVLFWIFVPVSWVAVGFYVFISGWSPCEDSGTCVLDTAVALLALLLMPVQILLAVYLKQRRSS